MLIGAEDLVPVAADEAQLERLASRAPYAVEIDVGGIPAAVRFADALAAAEFARRYVDLRASGTVQLHAGAIRDPELGDVFWSGPRLMRWPGAPLGPQAVAFLADAVALTGFFERHPGGAVSLHAAAVGVDGGVAAVIGDSTAGKTTTALACARRGMRLYTDERCIILDGRVVAFPRSIGVRAGGAALLLADAIDDPLSRLLRKAGGAAIESVRYRELIPTWSLPPAEPLRALFVLDRRSATPSVEPVPTTRAARAAARWAHGVGVGLDRIAGLLQLFHEIPCYRLELGTPAATAEVIEATLRSVIRNGSAA